MASYILLVEDDEHDLSFTMRALKLCSIENYVLTARDGEEAVSILEDGRKPLLILLDLKLPKIDGFTLLKRIRATPSLFSTPAIVVSGATLEADRVRALALGANNYIVKNMEFKEFAQMLCVALSPYIPTLNAKIAGDPFSRRVGDIKSSSEGGH